jgi:hypothetical protein
MLSFPDGTALRHAEWFVSNRLFISCDVLFCRFRWGWIRRSFRIRFAFRRTGWVRVSRRVGELVSKRAEGRGQGGAPHAMNDLAPCPRAATLSAPTRRDTRTPGDPPLSGAGRGPHPGARPAGGADVDLRC